MKKLLLIAVLGVAGCSQQLPEGKDNTTDQWERIADVPGIRGVYKVNDIEDGVICYYVVSQGLYNEGPNGISCLPAYLGE